MKNGYKNNIIPFYFISILFGVILAQTENNKQQNMELATFGAGCFWCVEAVFERLDGVMDVQAGYTGGNVKNPSYEDICTGTTGHAEVIQITYNADVIGFDKLLNIFWVSHYGEKLLIDTEYQYLLPVGLKW
jgi:peptide-methionine (S)-S-oxide reductase